MGGFRAEERRQEFSSSQGLAHWRRWWRRKKPPGPGCMFEMGLAGQAEGLDAAEAERMGRKRLQAVTHPAGMSTQPQRRGRIVPTPTPTLPGGSVCIMHLIPNQSPRPFWTCLQMVLGRNGLSFHTSFPGVPALKGRSRGRWLWGPRRASGHLGSLCLPVSGKTVTSHVCSYASCRAGC